MIFKAVITDKHTASVYKHVYTYVRMYVRIGSICAYKLDYSLPLSAERRSGDFEYVGATKLSQVVCGET